MAKKTAEKVRPPPPMGIQARPEPSVIKERKVKKRLEIPCYKG
jgi:hypothetical protein